MEDWYSEENPPPTPAQATCYNVLAIGGLIFVAIALFGSGLYLWVNQ